MYGFSIGVLWTILMAILAHMAYSNGGMIALPIYAFLLGFLSSRILQYHGELIARDHARRFGHTNKLL